VIGVSFRNGTGVVSVGAARGTAAFVREPFSGDQEGWYFANNPIVILSDEWPKPSFGTNHGPTHDAVFLPVWFAVVLTAAFAAAPWLRWRYSLRSLLLATTLIAVVLGLICYAVQ
jgi:hypothetical protein